jgi:AraC-like DNA-binding protein
LNGEKSTSTVQASGSRYIQDMDILTDLFRESGLRRRLLDLRELPAQRGLRFPCERSVGFHVVVSGTAYIHAPGESTPIELQAGDVAVMARGCEHVLTTGPRLKGLPVATIELDGPERATQSAETTLVSGAYQLWNTPVHPFFAQLPAWFVLRAERSSTLSPVALTVAMLADEARSDALGRDTVLHGLLDVLFTQLLRLIVEEQGDTGAGFGHAIRDPHIRQVVTLLHREYARDWTLDALARAVGLSRSVLAERFRVNMGDTPLAYLRTVRLQRAMRLLAEGAQTIEQVAVAVGYQDAFGFSKAFKKAVGESPGEFRKRNAAEEGLPWRLPASEAVGTG